MYRPGQGLKRGKRRSRIKSSDPRRSQTTSPNEPPGIKPGSSAYSSLPIERRLPIKQQTQPQYEGLTQIGEPPTSLNNRGRRHVHGSLPMDQSEWRAKLDRPSQYEPGKIPGHHRNSEHKGLPQSSRGAHIPGRQRTYQDQQVPEWQRQPSNYRRPGTGGPLPAHTGHRVSPRVPQPGYPTGQPHQYPPQMQRRSSYKQRGLQQTPSNKQNWASYGDNIPQSRPQERYQVPQPGYNPKKPGPPPSELMESTDASYSHRGELPHGRNIPPSSQQHPGAFERPRQVFAQNQQPEDSHVPMNPRNAQFAPGIPERIPPPPPQNYTIPQPPLFSPHDGSESQSRHYPPGSNYRNDQCAQDPRDEPLVAVVHETVGGELEGEDDEDYAQPAYVDEKQAISEPRVNSKPVWHEQHPPAYHQHQQHALVRPESSPPGEVSPQKFRVPVWHKHPSPAGMVPHPQHPPVQNSIPGEVSPWKSRSPIHHVQHASVPVAPQLPYERQPPIDNRGEATSMKAHIGVIPKVRLSSESSRAPTALPVAPGERIVVPSNRVLIPGTGQRRPDGTWRKPRYKKAGYCNEDDPKYMSKGIIEKKIQEIYVPGAMSREEAEIKAMDELNNKSVPKPKQKLKKDDSRVRKKERRKRSFANLAIIKGRVLQLFDKPEEKHAKALQLLAPTKPKMKKLVGRILEAAKELQKNNELEFNTLVSHSNEPYVITSTVKRSSLFKDWVWGFCQKESGVIVATKKRASTGQTLKRLQKKMKQIRALEEKKKNGEFLNDDQIRKLGTKSEIEARIEEMTQPGCTPGTSTLTPGS